MNLMLCIKGTARTKTVTGKVYECVGRFICPVCGKVSEILEFAPPVKKWNSISCWGCNASIKKAARYANQKRFIQINDPDAPAETLEDQFTQKPETCTT